MTIEQFLSLLSTVTAKTGGRYAALCPAHGDKSPSLSVMPGDQAILVKCWSGCTAKEIVTAMKLTMKDLWYDGPVDRAALRKARDRKLLELSARQYLGRRIDRWKYAELFVAERIGLDLTTWSDQRLDKELSLLSQAYDILLTDDRYLPFYER